MAEPAMAAIDLDVLDLGVLVVEAGLPGADAIRAAEDRGGRHGRRLRQRTRHMMVAVVHALPRGEFIDLPGVGRLGIAGEGAAEADHTAHLVGHPLGELARVDAAQTPADQAELALAVAVVELLDPVQHVGLDARPQAEIATLLPAVDRVALLLQETAQRLGGEIAGQQAGEHQHGMPVAARRGGEPWPQQHEGTQLLNGAALEQQQRSRGRTQRLGGNGHVASFFLGARFSHIGIGQKDFNWAKVNSMAGVRFRGARCRRDRA